MTSAIPHQAQSPSPDFGRFSFGHNTPQVTPPMMKVTAKPAFQWSSNAASAPLRMSSGFARTPSLLPRSLDVNFSLRYRR
jgi:hypothetical protein